MLLSIGPDNTSLLPGLPKFIGYIPQGFRVYGHSMTRLSSKYHARFRKQLFSDIIQPLRKIDISLSPDSAAGMKLGEVKSFANLVQESQGQGLPLWKAANAQAYQLEEAKQTFHQIANKIISLVK